MSNVINAVKSIFSKQEPTLAPVAVRAKINNYKLAEMRAEIIGLSSSLKHEKQMLKKFNKPFPSKDVQKHSSHSSIKNTLKWKARAKYITYGLLRGKPYNIIENARRDKEWYSSYEFRHLASLVSEEFVNAWKYNRQEIEFYSNIDNIRKLLGANNNEI